MAIYFSIKLLSYIFVYGSHIVYLMVVTYLVFYILHIYSDEMKKKTISVSTISFLLLREAELSASEMRAFSVRQGWKVWKFGHT